LFFLGSSHASSITIPIHFSKAETTWRYVPRLVARTFQCEQNQNTIFDSTIVILSQARAWLTMSLKLTENTAFFFAARKKLFREMAALAARIVYDDLAARCRSLAPVR
jgi:hypothetical protein